jgi:hypothetical protein
VAFKGRAAFPQQGLGYTRGSTDFMAGGSGSGAGTMAQGTASLGQGLGPLSSIGGAWEPSILYLVGLVIAEMIAFHIIGRVLSR